MNRLLLTLSFALICVAAHSVSQAGSPLPPGPIKFGGDGSVTPAVGDCVNILALNSSGTTVTSAGNPCGTGTVSPGTAGQVAMYSSTGTQVWGVALPGSIGTYCLDYSNLSPVTLSLAVCSGSFTPGGDLTGNSTSQQIAAIQGAPVLLGTPTAGQSLTYNGTDFVSSGTQCADVSANTTLSPTTPCVNVTTSGSVTITLPTAVGAQNPYTVSMDSSSTGTLVIATTSSQTINKAAASAVNYRAGWSYDFVSNNANWTLH